MVTVTTEALRYTLAAVGSGRFLIESPYSPWGFQVTTSITPPTTGPAYNFLADESFTINLLPGDYLHIITHYPVTSLVTRLFSEDVEDAYSITPDQFGGKDAAAINAAWAYFQSLMATGLSVTTAAANGLEFKFLGGLYNSGGGLITLTTAGFGQSISGIGLATRLNNIRFVVADSDVKLCRFQMENFGKVSDAITWTPRGSNIRHGVVEDVAIEDARYGLRTIDNANVGWIRLSRVKATKCVKGVRFDCVNGISLDDCHLSNNDEEGGVLYKGGELRMIGGRYRGNGRAGFRYDGSVATGRGEVVVENYIVGCSFGGNYANLANRRSHPITSAASNGAGGTRLTLDVTAGRHWLSNGLIKVSVLGTTLYDGDWSVDNVTNTTVDIDVAFAGTATGTIRDTGFDLEVIGDASLRPAQTNDLYIADVNCNQFYAKDAFNINFDNGRQKVRVFLDGGCYNIRRVAAGRGRFKSTLDDDTDEGVGSGTWKTVPITGQNYGFVEDLSDMGTTWTDPKGMVRRVPNPAVPLIGNMVQAYYSNQIDEDAGTTITGPLTINGDGYLPTTITRRLGVSTPVPFILVIEGQSNPLGAGTGQSTTINQTGGGIKIYSSLAGGTGGTMVTAAYGTAPLNVNITGGTTAVAADCVGQIGVHAANRIRELGLIDPARPIWVLVNAVGGISISEWVGSTPGVYTAGARVTAFLAAMAQMSTIYGAALTVDHRHWQQGEADGTTAGSYNTDPLYLAAMILLQAALDGSIYWTVETTTTVGHILQSDAYISTDTSVLQTPANNRNPALAEFANPIVRPKVGLVTTGDLVAQGTLAVNNNHFSGLGLQAIGERVANLLRALRVGSVTGAPRAPDGRALVHHPQVTVVGGETLRIGDNRLSSGALFLAASGACFINLPLRNPGENCIIELRVSSLTGGAPTLNCPVGQTMDGPLGEVTTETLGLGWYHIIFNGRWYFEKVSPRVGDYLDYAPTNLTPNTTTGLTQAMARGLAINSFAGCLIGLPPPEQGAKIAIIQRSITTFGAATLGRACASAVIAAGGTGYVVGDTIVCTLGGGATGTAPTVTVAAVTAGVITLVTMTSPGCITSSTTPTSPATQASTSGVGTGATVTITYSASQILGPRVGDAAYSYSLGTLNGIAHLEAIGPNWWVVLDTGVAGAIATQITSRTTGVTINTRRGRINLVSQAGQTTPQTFTVTNSTVGQNDVPDVKQKSGTDIYHVLVSNIADGSFKVTLFTTGGTTVESPVLNFTIAEGAAA